mmetsp:Transcript_8092/g.50047  ORF Transcript_8092/g.50047 Transcript_8092/m.50047 type:complete len:231 (+) Transcript_8092:372-1064(+)
MVQPTTAATWISWIQHAWDEQRRTRRKRWSFHGNRKCAHGWTTTAVRRTAWIRAATQPTTSVRCGAKNRVQSWRTASAGSSTTHGIPWPATAAPWVDANSIRSSYLHARTSTTYWTTTRQFWTPILWAIASCREGNHASAYLRRTAAIGTNATTRSWPATAETTCCASVSPKCSSRYDVWATMAIRASTRSTSGAFLSTEHWSCATGLSGYGNAYPWSILSWTGYRAGGG